MDPFRRHSLLVPAGQVSSPTATTGGETTTTTPRQQLGEVVGAGVGAGIKAGFRTAALVGGALVLLVGGFIVWRLVRRDGGRGSTRRRRRSRRNPSMRMYEDPSVDITPEVEQKFVERGIDWRSLLTRNEERAVDAILRRGGALTIKSANEAESMAINAPGRTLLLSIQIRPADVGDTRNEGVLQRSENLLQDRWSYDQRRDTWHAYRVIPRRERFAS